MAEMGVDPLFPVRGGGPHLPHRAPPDDSAEGRGCGYFPQGIPAQIKYLLIFDKCANILTDREAMEEKRMFKNMGLHTIKCPTGKFAYVGSIPVALAEIVEASTSDVMGGRAWTDEATGKI